MEKPPNIFEKGPESFDEHKDLIKYYEDLEAQEKAKEKVEFGPHVEEFEELLIPLLKEEILGVLNAIETEEEALNSKERESAKKALIPIVDKIKFLDRSRHVKRKEKDGKAADKG